MLVSELKTALKRYGFDDEDPLLIWLNAAYHEIEEEKDLWTFLETTEEVTLTAGTDTITTASLLKRPIKVVDVTDTANPIDLEYYDRRAFLLEGRSQTATGAGELFYRVGDREMKVWPKPEKTRKLLVVYVKELADLKEEAEEPKIPVANHYLIPLGAAYIGLQAENEEERAMTAENQFRNKLERMVNSDNEKQVGEAEYVEDVMEYYGD